MLRPLLIVLTVMLAACSQESESASREPVEDDERVSDGEPIAEESESEHAEADPDQPIDIRMVARQSYWTAVYAGPDGELGTEDDVSERARITVPVGRAVRFSLHSEDVVHSLVFPEFRAKKDAVPGRLNQMMIQPTEIAEYTFYCTEYCGQNHSAMIGKLHVVSEEQYIEHLAALGSAAIPTDAPVDASVD